MPRVPIAVSYTPVIVQSADPEFVWELVDHGPLTVPFLRKYHFAGRRSNGWSVWKNGGKAVLINADYHRMFTDESLAFQALREAIRSSREIVSQVYQRLDRMDAAGDWKCEDVPRDRPPEWDQAPKLDEETT